MQLKEPAGSGTVQCYVCLLICKSHCVQGDYFQENVHDCSSSPSQIQYTRIESFLYILSHWWSRLCFPALPGPSPRLILVLLIWDHPKAVVPKWCPRLTHRGITGCLQSPLLKNPGCRYLGSSEIWAPPWWILQYFMIYPRRQCLAEPGDRGCRYNLTQLSLGTTVLSEKAAFYNGW